MIPWVAVALSVGLASPAAPFSVDLRGFLVVGEIIDAGEYPHDGEDPVHEEITEEALRHVTPEVPDRVVRHVVRGNRNADGPTHKLDNVYHVNSANTTNGAFDDSFRAMRQLVDAAVKDARNNPKFLAPRHDTFHGMLVDAAATLLSLGVNRGCVLETACPKALLLAKATEFGVRAASFFANPVPDPHGVTGKAALAATRADLGALLDPPPDRPYCRPLSRHCFERLDQMLADDDDFQADVRHLRRLEQEIRAYFAWQNIGHAFHIVQDFFAHSNFVELLNNRAGPPCGRGQGSAAICGTPLPSRPEDLPRRTGDPVVGPFLSLLRPDFALSLDTLRRALPAARFARLQTGLVAPGVPEGTSGLKESLFCPDRLPPGFDYCHWPHGQTPGLNKDDAKKQAEEPAHANHAYARQVAVYASEILWEHVLRRAEFLPPEAPSRPGLGLPLPVAAALRERLLRQRALRAVLPLLEDDD
jgi:hypothetical protein